MRYQDGTDSVEIMGHYESGLEFDGDLRFPYFNSFGVRMLAVEPYWLSDGQDVQQLTSSKEVAGADRVIARIDGEWQALGAGANSTVREFARDPVTGDIYAAGAFTSMDGVANTRGIARWDGENWNLRAWAGQPHSESPLTTLTEIHGPRWARTTGWMIPFAP
jgi:hypothetical protein